MTLAAYRADEKKGRPVWFCTSVSSSRVVLVLPIVPVLSCARRSLSRTFIRPARCTYTAGRLERLDEARRQGAPSGATGAGAVREGRPDAALRHSLATTRTSGRRRAAASSAAIGPGTIDDVKTATDNDPLSSRRILPGFEIQGKRDKDPKESAPDSRGSPRGHIRGGALIAVPAVAAGPQGPGGGGKGRGCDANTKPSLNGTVGACREETRAHHHRGGGDGGTRPAL